MAPLSHASYGDESYTVGFLSSGRFFKQKKVYITVSFEKIEKKNCRRTMILAEA
jgi:hypothetical protein